jgi:regulator of Ty1 transposition protein 109
VLGGVDAWGWSVTGKKEHVDTLSQSKDTTLVTTVMGVRKKRKPSAAATTEPTQAIQDLAASVVRKKPKLEPAPGANAANGANTLTAGLVRKKPKA